MDKFKLYKKWFWMGLVMSLFYPAAGIVYGLVLLSEKDHRREGLIIIIGSFVIGLISYYLQSYLAAIGVFTPARFLFVKTPKTGEILFPTP